jgi:serine O-acetyltransferase
MEKQLINSLDHFKSYLNSDLKSMGVRLTPRSWIMDPVVRFVFLMRLCEYLRNTGKPTLVQYAALFWFRSLSVKLGFSLGPNIFGPGLAIVHYGLLIIDPTTRIGKNCRIHMGVHIGGAATFVKPGTESEYSPRIGDNVYIGPGAKIYGPVKIGNNCVIGANAVVTKSYEEDGLTIAGVPAKIIARNGVGERVMKGAD